VFSGPWARKEINELEVRSVILRVTIEAKRNESRGETAHLDAGALLA
jgi:hypothetical protein